MPIEIFKVLMYSTSEHGDEKMVKKLEACIDEFKLPPNITIELLSLNAQSKKDATRSQEFKNFLSVTDCNQVQYNDLAAFVNALDPPNVKNQETEKRGWFS